MNIHFAETVLRWLGGILALLTFALIFLGVYQGTRRPAGKTAGSSPGLLRSSLFYLAAGSTFFGMCILLWRPIPLALSTPVQVAALVFGSLLYFSGMAFALWGRLALGQMYFVSTGMGAQLFADHRLVTQGPFAVVRHPIYFGLTLAAVGGLLLFRTWTLFIFLVLPFALVRRARIEEQALAAAFGEQWQDYCRRVPMLIPDLRRLLPGMGRRA